MSNEIENGSEGIFDAEEFRENLVDDDLMREVIAEFNKEIVTTLQKLEAALSAGDVEALHTAAHSLKGLVGNFSAPRALAGASGLDAAARAGDLEAARSLYPGVQSEVTMLKDALGKFTETLA